MTEKWYVFLNQDNDGYEVNQLGKQAARSVPISLPYDSAALAHDNMITRQFFPLNDRQLQAVDQLKRVFGNAGPKAAARNQTFLDALILENRWRAGELRPAIVCRDAVRMVFDIGHVLDRAGKANVPWSSAICQLAEETADKVEKARAMAQLGHRTPAGLAAERIWLAYNQYATSSDA